MKIAVFVDEKGNVLPLYAAGTVELYVNKEDQWVCMKQIPFAIHDTLNIDEVRSRILAMIFEIDDCKMFVADTLRGFPHTIFEDKNIRAWKFNGVISVQLLDHIKGQINNIKAESFTMIPAPVAIDNVRKGVYKIDLVKVQEHNYSLNSKEILLPFLQETTFQELEVICNHVPKWFDKELGALKFQYTMGESTGNLCHAFISPDLVRKKSGSS